MRTIIKLTSTAGTGHFYTTTKKPKLKSDKLELRKYDPVARKHVLYREASLTMRRVAAPLERWPRGKYSTVPKH